MRLGKEIEELIIHHSMFLILRRHLTGFIDSDVCIIPLSQLNNPRIYFFLSYTLAYVPDSTHLRLLVHLSCPHDAINRHPYVFSSHYPPSHIYGFFFLNP